MLPSNYQCTGQMTIFEYFQGLQSGRTSPELSVQTVEKTSDVSLKNWQESKTPKFQFLNLRSGGGAGWIDLPHGCITWRTHDAQYWGVPQRRKRISLVVDFRDKPEPEIQFIAACLSGNPETSKDEREEIAGAVGESADTAISFQERGGKPGGVKESSYSTTTSEHCQPSTTKLYCNSSGEEVSGTLDASYYKGCGTRRGHEREVVCVGNGQLAQAELSEKVGALNCMHDQQAIILLESNQNHATIQTDGISTALPASMGMGGGYVPMVCKENVCYGLDRASFNQGQNAKYDISIQEDIAQPIVARGPGGVMQTK